MKRLIWFFVLFLFLVGCAPRWKPLCRHKALYAASVVAEERPVFVALGAIKEVPHSVAFTYIGKKHYYLKVLGDEIVGAEEIKHFKAKCLVSLGEYQKLMKIWREKERRKKGR